MATRHADISERVQRRHSTSTTLLTHIRSQPSNFTWGTVRKFVDVGDAYTIVEYENDDKDVLFHIYVDGRDTSLGAHSLESALVIAFGHKKLGPMAGPDMARAACKLLDITI